jgi:hypothetical protein
MAQDREIGWGPGWIELPGTRGRIHESDLKPCGGCRTLFFAVVLVRRPAGKDTAGFATYQEDVSVECPTCPLLSAKRSDIRRRIATLDIAHGIITPIKNQKAS